MCTLILIKVNNTSYGFYKLSSCSFPLSCFLVLSSFYSIILVCDSLFTFPSSCYHVRLRRQPKPSHGILATTSTREWNPSGIITRVAIRHFKKSTTRQVTITVGTQPDHVLFSSICPQTNHQPTKQIQRHKERIFATSSTKFGLSSGYSPNGSVHKVFCMHFCMERCKIAHIHGPSFAYFSSPKGQNQPLRVLGSSRRTKDWKYREREGAKVNVYMYMSQWPSG